MVFLSWGGLGLGLVSWEQAWGHTCCIYTCNCIYRCRSLCHHRIWCASLHTYCNPPSTTSSSSACARCDTRDCIIFDVRTLPLR